MKHLRAVLPLLILIACTDGDRGMFADDVPPLAETPPDAGAPASCVEAEAETRRAVDIVMSIDQSGSMADEIDALTKNINLLPPLLEASGLDYRFVMVAEVGKGSFKVCIPPPLGGPECSSNGSVFRSIDYHVESTDTLEILLKTLDYPTANLAWRDFLRPGVLKVFVPITDDDSTELDATAFDADLRERGAPLFGSSENRNYVFFPVVGINDYPDETACPSAAAKGVQYERLARLTNGRWFSVCRPSFQSILEEVGGAVKQAVSCEVAVPPPPAGATLDFEKINVRLTGAGGTPLVIPQDAGRPCTDGADGWQFSADKSKILLCGGACDLAKSDPATKFTVGFGCTTTVR